MTTAEWFPAWLGRHIGRHPLAGLPDMAKRPLYYEQWRDDFVKYGVTEQAADDASKALVAAKYSKNQHFNALLGMIRKAKFAGGGPREQAMADSKSCPECFGEGYASVTDRDTKYRFAAYCICPYGTWRLRKAQREAKPGTAFIDLASIRNGQTYRGVFAGRELTLDFSEEAPTPEPEPIHEPDFDHARW
jgi:hypothetical protein